MPAITGHSVLDELNATAPGVKCVVIVSATTPRRMDAAITPNVYALLHKPFNIEELVKTVRECVAESSARNSQHQKT